jgi:hypothetical protein
MADRKKEEEQDKGFVVKDKRFSAKKEEGDIQPKAEARKEEPPEDTLKEEPLPEINFINFMLSLATSALMQLGEIQDPSSKETLKNLPLAKQTIDLIAMLMEKTKGNLTPDEEKLVEQVLYDLRMRYVKTAG